MKKKAKGPSWLNRELHPPGPYMCLCLTQQDMDEAMKNLGIVERIEFVNKGKGATVHLIRDPRGNRVAIVCLRIEFGHTEVQRLAMLVHEAVHVWQYHCEGIGEDSPSDEFMAYGVQWISQQLFVSYFEQMASVPPPSKRKRRRKRK